MSPPIANSKKKGNKTGVFSGRHNYDTPSHTSPIKGTGRQSRQQCQTEYDILGSSLSSKGSGYDTPPSVNNNAAVDKANARRENGLSPD